MPGWGWIGAFLILAVGLFVVWFAVRRTGRPRRYFLGGAADPLAPTSPAPVNSDGEPVVVEESGDLDPVERETAPVPPEDLEKPGGPSAGGKPARDGAPGWADVTSPPPTARDPDGEPGGQSGEERGGATGTPGDR